MSDASDAAVLVATEPKPKAKRKYYRKPVKYNRAEPGATHRIDINTARSVLDSAAIGRFWAKVERGEPNKCWPWIGGKLPKGYGMSHVNSKHVLAHRLAYVLERGEIPVGLVVRHTCDSPSCCNPAHLVVGTYTENERDKLLRNPPDQGLILVVEAAEKLGMTPKQLRGRIFRNNLDDPIGDMSYIYTFCVERMLKSRVSDSNEAQ